MPDQKLLFLAYYFPPSGGGGSQRSLKFVKYLPSFGISPFVVAGAHSGKSRWAPLDAGLGEEINSGTALQRVNMPEAQSGPSRFWRLREWLGLSGRFGYRWRQAAGPVAARWCQEWRPDLIFATMSPYESADVAAALAHKFSVPWVADLRDPWALDEWEVYPTGWHRRLRRRQMKHRLQSASLIIMNTPEAAKRCREVFPSLAGIPVVSITNGFDAEDFDHRTASPVRVKGDHFVIVHAGALHSSTGLRQQRRRREYKMLGKTEPGVSLLERSHYYLLQALERWQAEDSGVGRSVKLRLIGVPDETDRKLAEQSAAAGMVEFKGYLPHLESLREVRQADLLFLPMHKLPPGRRATIVPGKTYEYLASGVPVLGAVPEGDARDFLIEAGTGLICEPDDVEGMLRILKTQYQAWLNGRETVQWNRSSVEKFERRELTRNLASALLPLFQRK